MSTESTTDVNRVGSGPLVGRGLKCRIGSIARNVCGRPAALIWKTKDGEDLPVCDRCKLSVAVCGGTLEALPPNTETCHGEDGAETETK